MPGIEPRRADATRNRERVLAAARTAFAAGQYDVSFNELARRAGVGIATLYRNFPTRRDLLSALYEGEVAAILAATRVSSDEPGQTFQRWLVQFFDFAVGKKAVVAQLLEQDRADHVVGRHRRAVSEAATPLYEAARASREIRDDITLDEILDLLIAIADTSSRPAAKNPMLRTALDGLRAVRG